jgi:anti-sigma factor RsiW
MTVTRDVVVDLLPVYLAGEASADTSRIVEAFMASDPLFAARVAFERGKVFALPPTPPPATTAEKETLAAAQRWLKHRTQTMVVAAIFTVLPLTFTFDDSGITFLLLRDKPKVALAWWATAAIMWACHFYIRRRTRSTGL